MAERVELSPNLTSLGAREKQVLIDSELLQKGQEAVVAMPLLNFRIFFKTMTYFIAFSETIA